jgi:DNA-binding beta-propeller fold protein YncE
LDLSADGSQLFVANSGAQSVSVVDVATNKETHKYIFAPNFINDSPYSLAAARNGLVFFTTTFAGSGFGGRMMQLNPSSGAITQRTDFWFYGTSTEATRITSNADHSLLAVVAGDISSGPVFEYSSSTDTFTKERDLNAFVSSVALDTAGDFMLVNPGTYVLDGNLSQLGIIADGTFGVAVDPSGTYGYAVSSASQVNVLDLKKATQISTLAIGDTVASGNYYGFGTAIGQMTISRDGGLLAIITDHGLSLVPTGVVHVVPFATFSAHVSLDIHEDSNASSPTDAFLAEGRFTLGTASNGINLVAHQLNFQIGAFSFSIPSGSFRASQGGFHFAGKVADYDVRAQITPEARGGYGFALRVKGVNLAGSVLPLTMALAIGDNAGTVAMPNGNAHFFGIDVTGRKDD